jgi:hypothetical protein
MESGRPLATACLKFADGQVVLREHSIGKQGPLRPNAAAPGLGTSHVGNRKAYAGGAAPKPFQAGTGPCSSSPRPQDPAPHRPQAPKPHRFMSGQQRAFSLSFLRQCQRAPRSAIVRLHSSEPLRQTLNHFHVVVPAIRFLMDLCRHFSALLAELRIERGFPPARSPTGESSRVPFRPFRWEVDRKRRGGQVPTLMRGIRNGRGCIPNQTGL